MPVVTDHYRPAMTQPPMLEARVVMGLARRFGVDATSCRHLRTSQSEVWALDSPDGTVVLHIHGPSVDRPQLAAMQRVRSLLATAGIPAVGPCVSASGETMLETDDGRLVELQPWVDHDRVINYGWEDVHRLCGVLARTHDVLSGDAALAAAIACREATSDLLANLERTHEPSPHFDTARSVLRHVTDREPTQLEPTHGDITDGNALIKGDEIAAIIDFGMLAARPRMADLGAAIFWSFFVDDNLERPESLPWHHARSAFASYCASTARPVTDVEAVDLVMEIARLPAAGVAVAYRELDPPAEVDAFGRALPLAVWLLEDIDRALGHLW
jgi:Ser/Thr protein kinase RdoA (MazF antagonist)